jgi:TPR repeat protein
VSTSITEPELVLRVEPDAAGYCVRGSLQGLQVTFLRDLRDLETARGLADDLRKGYGHFWKQQWTEARPLLERPALAGCADAQCAMGNFFHLAMGAEVDGARAADWYRKAAAQSHALACHCLGTLYTTGCGAIAPDALEAERWLTEARRLGLDLYGPGGSQLS